jgi:predicted signal transduction protein with EAL and GGDEF domain
MAQAPVAIIMGSQSDWATMRHCAETLDALGVGYEARIVSAHRTPDRLVAFAKGARDSGFKAINDAHGHEIGDRALVHVSTLLRNNVRASDSVGRLGGDEFAIILWHVDETAALNKASSLEAIVAASPFRDGDLTLGLSTSVGTAMLGPKETPEEVLNRADRAMYARKAR